MSVDPVWDRHEWKDVSRGALLLWADTLTRADILIAEIRSLQVNAIYGLRCGALLKLLRYEEAYVWGRYHGRGRSADWSDLFSTPSFNPKLIDDLGYAFVLPFPHERDRLAKPGGRAQVEGEGTADAEDEDHASHYRNDALEAFFCAEQRAGVLKEVRDRIGRLWLGGVWGQGERRDYYLCHGLQMLKRNILVDKLHLCMWGAYAFGMSPGGMADPDVMMKRFLFVRSAVQWKIEEAIDRLGEMHGQFEKSLDLAREEGHGPASTRRRRQGQYSAFLTDRLMELRHTAGGLLDALGCGLPVPAGNVVQACRDAGGFADELLAGEPMAFMAHTWRHQAASRAAFIPDEQWSVAPGDDPPVRVAMDVFSTSYFMPDRPEMQALLAGLAAWSQLRHRLVLADDRHLQDAGGEFAALLRKIREQLNRHGVDPRIADQSFQATQSYLESIARDLLAVALKGDAFIYALFLRWAGWGLEAAFKLPNGQIDLSLAQQVPERAYERVKPWWYLRLSIALDWLDAIEVDTYAARMQAMHEPTFQALAMRRYIRDTIDFLLRDEDLPPDGNSSETMVPDRWRQLAADIRAVVSSDPAAAVARNWRERRLLDDIRTEERSIRPLPEDVRRHLIDCIVRYKATARHRCLRRHLERNFPEEAAATTGAIGSEPSSTEDEERRVYALWRRFAAVYMKDENYVRGGEKNRMLPLFRKRADIPWECAVIRAEDFLGSLNERDFPAPISDLHLDFEPGSSLHQIAVEFDVWQIKPPQNQLEMAIAIVESIVPKMEHVEVDLQSRLSSWLNGSGKKESNDTVCLVESIINFEFPWLGNSKKMREKAREAMKTVSETHGAKFLLEHLSINHPERRRGYYGKKRHLYKLKRKHLPLMNLAMEQKIEELEGIVGKFLHDLDRNKRKLGYVRQLRSLYPHLRYKKAGERDGAAGLRKRVLHAMSRWHDTSRAATGSGTEPPALWRVEDIAHVTIASDVAAAEQTDGEQCFFTSVTDVVKRVFHPSNDWTGGPGTERVAFASFGRFDNIAFSHEASSIRTPLPILDNKSLTFVEHEVRKELPRWDRHGFVMVRPPKPTGEMFYPFFERRERGIRLSPFSEDGSCERFQRRLKAARDQIASRTTAQGLYNPPDVLAVIHVTLSQRESRLEFLDRVIAAADEAACTTTGSADDGPGASPDEWGGILEDLGDAFLPGDNLFLAEGTGDVLLVFRCLLPLTRREQAWRLDRISRLHGALCNDLLVRTSEIVWTPRVLDYLLASEREAQWSRRICIEQEVTLDYRIGSTATADFARRIQLPGDGPDGFHGGMHPHEPPEAELVGEHPEWRLTHRLPDGEGHRKVLETAYRWCPPFPSSGSGDDQAKCRILFWAKPPLLDHLVHWARVRSVKRVDTVLRFSPPRSRRK